MSWGESSWRSPWVTLWSLLLSAVTVPSSVQSTDDAVCLTARETEDREVVVMEEGGIAQQMLHTDLTAAFVTLECVQKRDEL